MMRPRVYVEVVKRAATAWNDDNAPSHGAAIAYYTIFSVAPLLLIAINLASLVIGEHAARHSVVSEIRQTLGPVAGDALTALLDNAYQAAGGTASFTVFGLILLVLGGSGVFVQLQDSLNLIWETEAPPRTTNAVVHFIKYRLFSFAAVFATGFLLLMSLVVNLVLAALSHWLTSFPGSTHFWQFLAMVVSFAFITLMFALIFKLLPDVSIAWSDVWLGALITAVLFTLGQQLLSLYLREASPASAYGAAGSLVVLLLWVYYGAQIMLFGAEFTHAYATLLGSHSASNDFAQKHLPTRERFRDLNVGTPAPPGK